MINNPGGCLHRPDTVFGGCNVSASTLCIQGERVGIKNGHNQLNKGGWGSEDVWERTKVGIVYRQDRHRGRRSRTDSIAGESSIILADVYRPDTDLGNLNVSASTLSDWGEGWGFNNVPTYYRQPCIKAAP